MSNFLYQPLNLPFEVRHPTLPKPSKEAPCSIHSYDIIDQRILDVIHSCGAYSYHSEVFAFAPGGIAPIHVDSAKPSNMAKFNIVVGTGKIEWYTPISSTAKLPSLTDIGTPYLMYSLEEVNLLHQAQMNGPSLINAGVPHGFVNNSSDACWVVSVVLFDLKTKDHIQFHEALIKFNKYINGKE